MKNLELYERRLFKGIGTEFLQYLIGFYDI